MIFEQSPATLDLFPFKGPDGKPLQKEMAAHGKKVAAAIGTVVGKAQSVEASHRSSVPRF